METMNTETILKKSAVTGNKNPRILIVLPRERFCSKIGDITPCLNAYMNDVRDSKICGPGEKVPKQNYGTDEREWETSLDLDATKVVYLF